MATYNPTTVEQLNRKRREASQTGASTTGGVLKDYDTFAASVAPVTPTTPPGAPATPATAYADLGLSPYDPTPDKIFGQYGRQLEKELATPFNERDTYRQKINQFQSEIDANNRIFSERLALLQQDKEANAGRARAAEAAGVGGYGGVVNARARGNQPIDLAAAELEAKVESINNAARTAADAEVANKRAARAAGYSTYTQFLKETDSRKNTYADEIAQAVVDQGLGMDKIDLETLSKTYGIPKQKITSAIMAKKKAAEAAAREQIFNEAKEELRYNPQTGEYESTAPPEFETVSPGSTLIDPRTGQVVYDNPRDPFTVSPGASVIDPETGEVIFTAPESESDEILSPTEAQALGVPYGTTESQAAGMGITPQKPPTLAQEKNRGFYERAKFSHDIVSPIEDEIAKMGLLGQARLQFLPNFLQGETNQKYRQAQRAFTEARLRQESGAAIPPSEYENDSKTYFAQPGDTAATLAQKRAARQVVLDGLIRSSGPVAAPETVVGADGNEYYFVD